MTEFRKSDAAFPATDTSGSSPGAILRRCREYHEITLEEASETTKIGISHLKALEDDRIREFANQAYLKGFLRIYATYLGLNSDDVARMYDKLFGAKAEKPDSGRSSNVSTRPARRLLSLKRLLFPVLLLAVILVTATFYKNSLTPLVRQPLPSEVVVPPLQNSAIQTMQSSSRSSTPEPDIPQIKTLKRPVEPTEPEVVAVSKRPADGAKGFILKIKVTQNGTLAAAVDDSGPQQYELTSGDIIEWKAERKVTLELSNAGGVEVELNGKPYKALGLPGKPAYIELDADGIKP